MHYVLQQKTSGKIKTYRGKVPTFRPITMTPITDDKSTVKQQQSLYETGTGSNIQVCIGISLLPTIIWFFSQL